MSIVDFIPNFFDSSKQASIPRAKTVWPGTEGDPQPVPVAREVTPDVDSEVELPRAIAARGRLAELDNLVDRHFKSRPKDFVRANAMDSQVAAQRIGEQADDAVAIWHQALDGDTFSLLDAQAWPRLRAALRGESGRPGACDLAATAVSNLTSAVAIAALDKDRPQADKLLGEMAELALKILTKARRYIELTHSLPRLKGAPGALEMLYRLAKNVKRSEDLL